MITKAIKQFNKDVYDAKNHFDLILYVCKLQDRTFLEMEIPLLKYLIKSNKKIIFVLNNHGNTKSECKKLLEMTKSSLKQIVNAEKEIETARLNEILKNMVIICLKQKIEYDDEEEEVEIKQ